LAAYIRGRGRYRVRAVVGFGLNHRMWPGSDDLAKALKELDLLVNVELFKTDTARLGHFILPACSSLERSELKFYPQKYAVWTQPAVDPVGRSRPDTEIIRELARRLTPEDRLLCAGHEDWIDWILEPSGLSLAELKKQPAGMAIPETTEPGRRKYLDGGLATPSGKMELASSILDEHGYDPLPVYREPGLSPLSRPGLAREYPLILTTGARLPMFIHSRTFRLPSLRAGYPDPMVDIHPDDARERGLAQGDPVRLATIRGEVRVRANLTESVPRGVVSLYHGWPQADANLLIPPDYLDPISGFPGFKSLLCQVYPAPSAQDREA